jgi:short-subunit dehydrogenase
VNALITGASSGLGREFALQLAREKFGLVLVARREDKLSAVAESARKLGAPAATVIAADLAQSGAAATVHRKVTEAGIEIDWLINNAGFGTTGPFERLAPERELEEINLNVTALVALTRMFLPAMVERRRGNIINVASTAAFQAVPWMATYGATKAFVLSFSEALACELRGTGVSVLALCPGPTRTEFQSVAHVDETKIPSLSFMDSATVVAQAIAAARRGKSLRINGLMNFVLAEVTRFAPRSLTARIAGAMFRNSGV